MARRRTPLHPLSPISIGNFEVSEPHQQSLQISLSKTAKIQKSGDYYFVLVNPNDPDEKTKALTKEVLNLYLKELPAMNYAANTGKESMFLEKCLTNGKYCSLLLKSKEEQPVTVIASITYQIIPADTQYAEVPLAAVSSIFQRKGIGRLLYLELRSRLQNVGIRNVFCWGDKESEGFWLKQGFTVIGKVDKKGKAHRLRIKADLRRALCFPGDSTLMVSHLLNDSSPKPVAFIPMPTMLPEMSCQIEEIRPMVVSDEIPKEVNLIPRSQYSESQKQGTENLLSGGHRDVDLLSVTKCCSMANVSRTEEDGGEINLSSCSRLMPGTKRMVWEASCTSMKSKKVKGTQSCDSQMGSQSPAWTSDERIANCFYRNCFLDSGSNNLSDACLKISRTNTETNEERTQGNIKDKACVTMDSPSKCIKIMLMNIADDNKKSNLTKVIEDLGGVVTFDGSVSTHVVTGKARKTLNFCTALCSGSWIISPGWLKESFKKGRFVEETPFILDDEEYKSKYRTELKCAVLRAKASPNSLLQGLDIWLSTHVQPPAKTLLAIIKCAGGNVIGTNNELKDVSKTIFVACEEDMEEARLAVKLGTWTFSVDWLMNCIMRHELDLEAPQFAESL